MKLSLHLLIALLLVMVFPLFFLGIFQSNNDRIWQEIWNMGHVLFFGGLTYSLISVEFSKSQKRRFHLIHVSAIVLVLAAFIEVIQVSLPNRTADLHDLLNGIAGGGIVLSIYSSYQGCLIKRVFFLSSATCLAGFSLYPLCTIVYDEISVYRSFPLLSGLESRYEIKRWMTQEKIKRVKTPVKSGRYSLRVSLAPGKYPGVSLQHFPPNWKNATSLQFSVFNPKNPFVLHYRLHDSDHEEGGQRYDDRFNDKQEMFQGWNTVTVPLAKVESAPATRLMDLESMRNLTIFLINSDQEKLFFIDDVRLIMGI